MDGGSAEEAGTAAGRGEEAERLAAALVALSEYADTVPVPEFPLSVRALAAVDRCEGLGVTGLAAVLGATLPSASRLCRELEDEGLLVRRSGAGDRRRRFLELTRSGAQALARMRARRAASLAGALPRSPESLAGVLDACALAERHLRRATATGDDTCPER